MRLTAAHISVEGEILVGQSAGDWGARGWPAAIDATDGDELWRTYTIHARGEPGREPWKID